MNLQNCPKRDSLNLCENREFCHGKGSLRKDFISRRISDHKPLWALCSFIAHEVQHSFFNSFFPNLLDKNKIQYLANLKPFFDQLLIEFCCETRQTSCFGDLVRVDLQLVKIVD